MQGPLHVSRQASPARLAKEDSDSLTLEVLSVRRAEGAMPPAAPHELNERKERLGLQQELLCLFGWTSDPWMPGLHVGDHIRPGREGLQLVSLATCNKATFKPAMRQGISIYPSLVLAVP